MPKTKGPSTLPSSAGEEGNKGPLDILKDLSGKVGGLRFAPPVAFVYNPLEYAWAGKEAYVSRYGQGTREVLFVGMNPGPFGMAQTGVPFGEIAAVRDWMGLEFAVKRPAPEHPKRPILGLGCTRKEVSGARLWGWAKERFGKAERFFERAFVHNYCPLLFMEASGRNLTPDKLPAAEKAPLEAACDEALRAMAEYYRPKVVVGVGAFAEARCRKALDGMDLRIGTVLHPSPASPMANKGWAAQAEKQLEALGVRF
jgi:single-strand selective monofunctional uracil DNA glycosylase